MAKLAGVASPSEQDMQLLEARERELEAGTHKVMVPKTPDPPPVKKKAAKRAPKKKKSDAESSDED